VEQLLIFVATGAFAGLLAGLFGIGGGMIMVPILAFLLPARGVPTSVVMQVSIATSMAVIAATSVSSTLSHHRHGGVRWDVFRHFAPGLVIGALLGAYTAHLLPGLVLRRIVGVGALLTALQLFFGREPKAREPARPHGAELAAAGGLIGWLSSLIGIGGGSLTAPYLSLRGMPMRQAVGTAAAGGMPIAWAGAFGFIWAGWGHAEVPAPALGYVSLSGFAGLAVASVLAAPWGARLAHGLPQRTLRRAFAVMLSAVAAIMLID
jgi:uncharacterized protein